MIRVSYSYVKTQKIIHLETIQFPQQRELTRMIKGTNKKVLGL